MDDTVRNDVLDIARLLDDHRGEEVSALYIGEMSDWTDYFIISTVRSNAHLKGLLRLLNEVLSEKSITPLRSRKLTSLIPRFSLSAGVPSAQPSGPWS